jgi:hypothetical protein
MENGEKDKKETEKEGMRERERIMKQGKGRIVKDVEWKAVTWK